MRSVCCDPMPTLADILCCPIRPVIGMTASPFCRGSVQVLHIGSHDSKVDAGRVVVAAMITWHFSHGGFPAGLPEAAVTGHFITAVAGPIASVLVKDRVESVGPQDVVPLQMTCQTLPARIQATGQRKFVVSKHDDLRGAKAATDLLAFSGKVREVR